MAHARRFPFVMTAASCSLLVALLLCLGAVDGQVIIGGRKPLPQPQPSEGTASQFSAIKLIEKPEYRQYINVARDCIKDKAWNEAVTALQVILENKEDYYVRVEDTDASGRKSHRWTSVKYEANKLLGSMPDEGLDVYEVRYGGKARQLLEEAKKNGELEKLAAVAQQYMHTSVGAEANDLLATYYLDRGQYFMAALRFERILQLNSNRVKLDDLVYLKMALAYRRAGDLKNADAAWERLQQKLRRADGLKIGEQLVSLERLRAVLDEVPRPESASALEWPLVRGNISNSAFSSGSPPLLDEILWFRPTVLDKSDITGEIEERGREAKARLESAITAINNLGNVPVLPGQFPIATHGKMIYRTYSGLTAVTVQAVKNDRDEIEIKPGEIEWKSTEFDGSLAICLSNPDLRSQLESWLNMYNNPAAYQSIVYENTLNGTLSSDGRIVFAVDDLAVPVPPNVISSYMWNQGQISQTVKKAVLSNSMHAYDLVTGKGLWRLGVGDPRKREDFLESHFLGAPLPVGGKLYALNEKNNGELGLVTIEPQTGTLLGPVQALGTVEQRARITHDPNRRTNACQMAYSEGILVCPTNAGEILGVDLMSRTLAWAYSYREKAPNEQPQNPFQPFPRPGMPLSLTPATWKWAPPAIVDGKVIFTAPDAHSIHCVNLRDGTFAWKKPQTDGELFFAGVVDGKVLIVGRNNIKARRLSDGEVLWNLSTGDMPSGHGVASRNIYYLPLKKGEILKVDVARGMIQARNRASASTVSPGNLVFYEGAVLSQAPMQVMAYPQLTAKLVQADQELQKDPENTQKLLRRGELRLADGQVKMAVNDLRTVLRRKPTGDMLVRVRHKLYDALTDLMQVDFRDAADNYIEEYRELCRVPENSEEEQRRQAKFFRLLGQGREAQGNLVEAFTAYRQFGSLPVHQKEGVVVLDDPTHKVPTQVWLRGRIGAMMSQATPAQRKPLEAQIAQEWQGVKATKQLDAIRGFVSMFDVPFEVGREARLHLADTIMEKNQREAFLEAELSLEQLRVGELAKEPGVGGRALDALARLEIRKGTGASMQEAARMYRELGDRFADVTIRDGKSGKGLVDDLASDKRFLLYLDQGGTSWGAGAVKARELATGAFDGNLQGFMYQPDGDLTPSTTNLRLILDYNRNQNDPTLRLVDLAASKVKWNQNLGLVQNNYMYFNFLRQQLQNNPSYLPNARFRLAHVKGHLAVVQVGTMVYAVDLDNPRLLWSHGLLEGNLNRNGQVIPQQVMPDRDGNLQIVMWNQFNGQRQLIPIGHVGAVQASYVALVKHEKLVVLDPLRGTVLWTKGDIDAADTRVFGDDQHIYLVDVSGGNATGGRVLRASDGATVEVPDFSGHYQNRVRIEGRHILAATPSNGLTLRWYDAFTGKDVWKKHFAGKAVVLQTDDPNLTGVVEANGDMTVLEVQTGKELLRTNVLQGRVAKEDIANLQDPLLLEDREHFYVAFNQPVDPQQVAGGVLSNNFGNGIRCAKVNGWVSAFYKETGQGTEDGKPVTWKKGELHWHSYAPISNQLIVLEQFRELPMLLFTVRYHETPRPGVGGGRWLSITQSINKTDGKMIYDPVTPRVTNGVAPQFYTFKVDRKGGTIDLIGITTTLQHYIDDGRKQTSDARQQPDGTTAAGPNRATPPAAPPVPAVEPNGRVIRVLPVQGGAIRRLPAPLQRVDDLPRQR